VKHIDGLFKSGNIEHTIFVFGVQPDLNCARTHVGHRAKIFWVPTALDEFQLTTGIPSDIRREARRRSRLSPIQAIGFDGLAARAQSQYAQVEERRLQNCSYSLWDP
jgi:hypothetical protein